LDVLTRWSGLPQGVKWALGVLVAVLLALAVGWLLFVAAADWLATHDVGHVTGALRPSSIQTARDAARGRLLTYGAGLFAAGALIFTARNFALSREAQVTNRYTKAIEQLGSDSLDVRIGGFYALERVARDSAKDHPTVMDVLAAFIREHSREQWPPATAGGAAPTRTTRPDVQAAATVIGRRNVRNDRGRIRLAAANLTSAYLTGANFADGFLYRAIFDYADLPGAYFTGADLTFAHLRKATLTGADLRRADLRSAEFNGANLTGADFARTTLLTGALFTEADLAGAIFTGANLKGAHFYRANLTGADLAEADLAGADFKEADLTRATWPADVPVPAGWERDLNRLKRP
jgi:hypothetical protein